MSNQLKRKEVRHDGILRLYHFWLYDFIMRCASFSNKWTWQMTDRK